MFCLDEDSVPNIKIQDGTTKTIQCDINVKCGQLLCENYWKDFGNMTTNQQYTFETKLFAKEDPVHLLVKYVPTSHLALKDIIVKINNTGILPTAKGHIHITLEEFVKENERHEIIIPRSCFAILKVIVQLKDSFQITNRESRFLQEIQVISVREAFLGPDHIVYEHRPFCFIMSGTLSSSKQNIIHSNISIETLNSLFTDILSISWDTLGNKLDLYRNSANGAEKKQVLDQIKNILNGSFQNRQTQNDFNVSKLIDEIQQPISGLKLAHYFIQTLVHTWNIHPVLTLLLSQVTIENPIDVAAACLSPQLFHSYQQHIFIELVSLFHYTTKFNLSSKPSYDQMITILDCALRPSPALFEIFSKFLGYGCKILTEQNINLDYIVQHWPWNTNILKQTAISISKAISVLFVDQNISEHEKIQNLADFFKILIKSMKPNLNLLWNSYLQLDMTDTISISESFQIICNMIPEDFSIRQEAYLLADIAKTLLHFRARPQSSLNKLTSYSVDLLDCQTDEIRTIWTNRKPRWESCIICLITYILDRGSIVETLLRNSHRWPEDEEELQNYIRRVVGHEIQDEYIQNTAEIVFLWKKSLRDGNSSSIISNASSLISYCSKIGLIPPSKRISYLNRALLAIERLYNYFQTYDNSAIDIWSELVILCGCISDKWRKSPVWYASDALFQFEKHPSMQNALSIFIQGLYQMATENNCSAFINQFISITSFNENNHKAKLKTIFDVLNWSSSSEIINARNECEFLHSLEKVNNYDVNKAAKSMLSLWQNYKILSNIASMNERFQSVFFNIIEVAINEGYQIPSKDLKQLINAVSLYAHDRNNQLFDAIRSPSLILSAMNVHKNLLISQGKYSSSSEIIQTHQKPVFMRNISKCFLDKDKLPKYKPSFSYENEDVDNPNQWLKRMIKPDEVGSTVAESISTTTSSIDEHSNDNFDSSSDNNRYENVKIDSNKVSTTLQEIMDDLSTSSKNRSFTEEQLLNSIVRLSQIVSNWSRSFTNICSLIRNDKHVSDERKSLAFQIIIDGVNLLRYLLGLEKNFAIFVSDPLSQFIQGQMRVLRNKLSSIPIRMVSEELSSQFQHLHIFKQKTDDEDEEEDTIPVLEGNIYKKTDEKTRKSDVDHDDPFAHLKHGEQTKIVEKIRNIDKEKQKFALPSFDSFFPNETVAENNLNDEEKPKTLELKFVKELQRKILNSSQNVHKKRRAEASKTDTSKPTDSHSNFHPVSNYQPNPRTDYSDMSNTDVEVQTSLDRIAEINFTTQMDTISHLTPSKEKIRELLNDENIYDLYRSGSYRMKQNNPMAVYNSKLEDLLNIPSETWTYQKLASCESIKTVIDTTCAIVRDELSDLFSKISNPVAT
ncbi:unnamed protein product [Rotaria sp. Silwood1]|nr:unnamed protein product [Rotaria sp. Silwood1]